MNMEKETILSSRDYPAAGVQKHIRLLDCTLRDGGHINQGKFGEIVIKSGYLVLDFKGIVFMNIMFPLLTL